MKLGVAVLLFIGLAYVGCQIAYPTHSFRYRLTLAVEADGKVHTGSSVVEVTEPWLTAIKGGYLDGQFAGGGPALANILHGGDFKRGP